MPAPTDDGTLIVGRANTVHLQAGSVACIDRIMVKDPAGKELRAEWSPVKANEVEISLPLQQAEPGAVTLLVSQYGAQDPQPVELRAFAEAGRLESFSIHTGETQGVLKGSGLDEVMSLSLEGLEFTPATPTTTMRLANDELLLAAKPDATAVSLQPGKATKGKVTLRDGRTYSVNVSVGAPRPSAELIGKSIQASARGNESRIQLVSDDQLPQDAQLTFSVRARTPATFGRDENIEVATEDEAFSTTLTIANRGITLADSKVAVATFDPAKAFGLSAFGHLKFRVVANGVAGDWQPLATLVRLPVLQTLQCPATPEKACKLTGAQLFLVDSVSGTPEFKEPIQVPEGFPGRALPVPHPGNGSLYLKLRDDPSVINSVALVAEELPAPPSDGGTNTSDVGTPPAAASAERSSDTQ
jgi:hypothetical protein